MFSQDTTPEPCPEGSEVYTTYMSSSQGTEYINIYADGSDVAISTVGSGNSSGDGTQWYDDETSYKYFCLPENAMYTVKLHDTSINTVQRAVKKFYIVVDDFRFDYGAIEGGTLEYSKKFYTGRPFKTTTEWKFSEVSVENWNAVGFNDASWVSRAASEFGTSTATAVYIRKEFTIPSSAVVLNVQVKYTGGVVAYFNGNKVARFNLPETFDSDTVATEAKSEIVSSTFSIILSANGAIEGNNVIAFEIHSGSADSHTITFSATGVYGVNECSILTNSVSGTILNNYYSEHYIRQWFDMNPASYEGMNYRQWNYPYPGLDVPIMNLNAYVEWSVDNLEPAQYNAFGFLQYEWDSKQFQGCDVEWKTPVDSTSGFTTIASGLNQTLPVYSRRVYSVSDTYISGREFQINIPKRCSATRDSVPTFPEVSLEYCVTPRCPADGEYPSVMNGQKSTIRCPAGYSGYKSRSCVNGVLETTVEDGCVAVNEITYDRENLLVVFKNEEVSFTPSTLYEVSAFTLTGTLPTGLSFDSTTGVISGTATAVTSELNITIADASDAENTMVLVVLIVVDEVDGEVFAVTKNAEVKDINGVTMAKLDVTSYSYDYYNLIRTQEYVIYKEEGATVIPPEGNVWKYTRPSRFYSFLYDSAGSSIGHVHQPIITPDDAFTHYIHTFTMCPTGKSYVSVRSVDGDFFAQYCVTPNKGMRLATQRDGVVVRDINGNVIPVAVRLDIYNEYIVPQETVKDEEEKELLEEVASIFAKPENTGVVGIVTYLKLTLEQFVEKLMMNSPYSSSASPIPIIRPSLTFENGNKKTIMNWRKLKGLGETASDYASIQSHKNYIIETALTMMEIVYYMKNNQEIQLSRTQLSELVADYCTESDCGNNWKIVMSALKNSGVCKDGETGECTKYKMVGFTQPSGADRNTKWIKEQIDAGKPVFVILSVDPEQTQHHIAEAVNPINKAAPGLMNFGGVVIGYNAEREGYEYWEIAVRRHGDGNNMIKVKMDVNGKNFARISNYAFTIEDVRA